MAKRKRLTPARDDYLTGQESAGLETKSFPLGSAAPPPSAAAHADPSEPGPTQHGPTQHGPVQSNMAQSNTARPAPPIASVSREASASAALSELSESVERARAEGRMVLALPLSAVEAGYIVRDRIAVDDEEAAALRASLRARGQQTPIEVAELGQGRYGLISGWRRLTALAALEAETGEARFGTVLALVRRPEEASDAYLAMVEENEIRVGLSYYERARIVARSVELGVYPGETEALRGLFGAASRARRSKIKSYLAIVAALDGILHFPRAISERLGLRLSKALEEDPALAGRIADRLAAVPPGSAEAELACLTAALEPAPDPALSPDQARDQAPDPAPAPDQAHDRPVPPAGPGPEVPPAPVRPRLRPGQSCELTRGVRMHVSGTGVITLSGPGAGDGFRTRLLELFGAEGG